jgi:hypothetical protein
VVHARCVAVGELLEGLLVIELPAAEDELAKHHLAVGLFLTFHGFSAADGVEVGPSMLFFPNTSFLIRDEMEGICKYALKKILSVPE